MLLPGFEVGIEDGIEDTHTHTQRQTHGSEDVIETSLGHGLGLSAAAAAGCDWQCEDVSADLPAKMSKGLERVAVVWSARGHRYICICICCCFFATRSFTCRSRKCNNKSIQLKAPVSYADTDRATDTDTATSTATATPALAVDTTTSNHFAQYLPRKSPWHSPRHETAAGIRRHTLPAEGHGVNAARRP